MPREKKRTLLTVTVDINDRISLTWGNPTGTQDSVDGEAKCGHCLAVEDVSDARLRDDGKTLIVIYGEGKTGRLVSSSGYTLRVLVEAGIKKILVPKYFIRSRSGGRIAVFEDGLEANVLSVLGAALGIADPSWKTMNCWDEDVNQIVSRTERPIGGSVEYSRAYYARTAEVRRKQARTNYHTSRNAPAIASTVDELIALAKQGGGGGPQ